MKAAPVFMALSLCLSLPAYAKQPRPTDNDAGGPHALQAMHHDEPGTVTYRGRGIDGEKFSLKIGPAHNGRSWIAVYVGADGCLGDIAGTASVRGDALELRNADFGFPCSLTVHHSATGATIVENSCASGHGPSCSFDTQGNILRPLLDAPVAEEPQKRVCGIVHDYVDAHKIMDGKFNPYWDHTTIAPPRDSKGLASSPLLREGNCLCIDGALQGYDRGGQRAYKFTEILDLKTCQ